MPRRGRRILLIAALLWLSWLAMMLVHEAGHAVVAISTGGTVRRFVWHPAVLSRTDVQPNPHPIAETWAGPLFGSAVPLLAAAFATVARFRRAYLLWVFAGFCLIANGSYIGLGVIDAVGDSKQLIALGVPEWLLGVFGCVTVPLGFWMWDRASPSLGFGRAAKEVSRADVYVCVAVVLVVTVVGVAFGDRGI